jgi:hypothetical protein
MFKPLEIFNDIVNGLILGVYDIILLITGPLIAPLRRRSVRIWKFILEVENRLSSLTLMFICMAGLVTVHAPGLLRAIVQESSLKLEKFNSRFLYVAILTIVLTIFFDVLFRLLVYLRTISLGVEFSRIRMVVLRLYFSVAMVTAMIVELVIFVVWYNSRYPDWVSSVRLLIISLSAIPFSLSLLHLTQRLRVWAKWLVAVPFSYSFVNLTLAMGFYLGLFLAVFFMVVVDPEQVRLFAFNTRCMMIDKNTVSVESDLLLKTDLYDVVEAKDGSVFADVGNQIISLSSVNGIPNILVSGKVVHTKWRGTLLLNVERPKLGAQATPCKIETYETFWSEPERVKVVGGPE